MLPSSIFIVHEPEGYMHDLVSSDVYVFLQDFAHNVLALFVLPQHAYVTSLACDET